MGWRKGEEDWGGGTGKNGVEERKGRLGLGKGEEEWGGGKGRKTRVEERG